MLRVGGVISPFSTIDVKQTTLVQPLITTNGESHSNLSQNISYDIKLAFKYKLTSWMTLHANSDYTFLPISYDLAIANVPQDSYDISTIQVEETRMTNSVKISFNIDSFSKELSPSIGYAMQSASSKDVTNNTKSSLDTNIWILGFEGRF